MDEIIKNGSLPPPISRFNALAVRMLSGEFLTADERARLDFRKMIARTTKPKTRRVKLNPDWLILEGPGKWDRKQSKAERGTA